MPNITTSGTFGFAGKRVEIKNSLFDWKETQGIYLKLGDETANWEASNSLGFGGSITKWNARLIEIQENVNFKGFQIDVTWGLYEKGTSGGDFSNLDYLVTIADDCQAIGRYLILQLGLFREFRNSDVSSLPIADQMRYLLPPDMRTHSGTVDSVDVLTSLGETIHTTSGTPSSGLGVDGDYAHDSATNILYGPKASGAWPAGVDLDTNDPRAHYLWDYAYAYQKSLNSNFGYDLKTYSPYLRSRLAAFYTAVHALLGNHPAVICITSTESVVGEPLYTGAGGMDGTRQSLFDGKTTIMDGINSIFTRQMVMQSVNFPNEGTATTDPIDYVNSWYSQIATKRYSITMPNSQWWSTSLNRTGTASAPRGATRAYGDYTNIAPRFVQWQGDEFDSDTGASGKAPPINNTAGYTQRYADLYTRATVGDGGSKFALNATHIIIQYQTAQNIWPGGITTANNAPNVPVGTVVPSLKAWLKDGANVPQDGYAGLYAATPSYIT